MVDDGWRNSWKSKRIAVVGNGPLGRDDASLIDGHEKVVRFNGCASYGRGGVRTDAVALVNTGPPGRAFGSGEGSMCRAALHAASEIWLAKPPRLIDAEICRRPDRAHLWTDYSRPIVERLTSGKRWLFLEAEVFWAAQTSLEQLGSSDDWEPSTGMLVLFHLRRWARPCQVTLFGFSHQGWSGHHWESERALIGTWANWIVKL